MPGFINKTIITKNKATTPSTIFTYNIKFPISNPAPAKKSPNPLPSLGTSKKGSLFGSSLASPTGFASAKNNPIHFTFLFRNNFNLQIHFSSWLPRIIWVRKFYILRQQFVPAFVSQFFHNLF